MGRILIGNIKGPQGAQGIQGPQGPVGATGPMGPMPDLINNALASQAGIAALDAAMGKTLQDQITKLNSETVTTYEDSERINLHSTKGIHNLCLAKDGIFAATILILNTGIGNDNVYSLAFEFDENTQKWKLHLYNGNRVLVGTIVSA